MDVVKSYLYLFIFMIHSEIGLCIKVRSVIDDVMLVILINVYSAYS